MYVHDGASPRVAKLPKSVGRGGHMFFPFRARSSAERRGDGRVTPAKHVVSTVHGARTVLLDSRSGRYYGLDEVGSRIWGLAQAGFAPSSIAEKLAEEYDASSEQLRRDVQKFLASLRHSHLLEDQ